VHGAWSHHAQPLLLTPYICVKALGDRSIRHDALKLHIDAARQASFAQGIARRSGQCAWNDRHHHVEDWKLSPLAELFIKTVRAGVMPLGKTR
jgi:hypothetical protein